MKLKILSATVFTVAMTAFAHAQGIKFTENLSWDEVKAKAKNENKYVFVDVNATWCVPCKQMDQEIFTLSTVGEYFNSKFISIKVQMDTTSRDSETVRKWRADAKMIEKTYGIDAYPTFLFFSPDGELLQKVVGAFAEAQFIQHAKNAQDPKLSLKVKEDAYRKLKSEYKSGDILSWDKQLSLMSQAYFYKDTKFGDSLAENYYSQYVNKLPIEELRLPVNLRFITFYSKKIKSSDYVFSVLYNQPDILDNGYNEKGTSQKIINFIVSREEILNKLYDGNKQLDIVPDWKSIHGNISNKYSEKLASDLILKEKYNWYRRKEDWNKAIEYGIQLNENSLLDTSSLNLIVSVNNFVYYQIFMHATQRRQLKAGKKLMEVVLKHYPNAASSYDTYAGLMYRLGNKKKAIEFQEKAIQVNKELNLKREEKWIEEEIKQFNLTLDKMKKGLQTWK